MGETGLLPMDIREGLETAVLGRRVYWVPVVDSTNRMARDLAGLGEADGTLVITEYQTRGRGQRGRRWESPAGRDLLFSLILRPDLSSERLLPITLAFSLGLAESLSPYAGVDLGVKWPNDVVSPDGKVCGILSESVSESGRVFFAVVGIGINLNTRPDEFPRGLSGAASSCCSLSGKPCSRGAALVSVLGHLDEIYSCFRREGFAPLMARYNSRLQQRGQKMDVGGGHMQGTDSGVVSGIAEDGGLVIETADGARTVTYESGCSPA